MTFRPFSAGMAALVVAVSCGGSTENVGTSRSAGGSAGGGAGGSGGASGRAGSSGAGSAGTAGTSDAGGPDCFAEPRSGEHCGMGSGVYFDPASRTCRSYGPGTCFHGPNSFSLRGCLETCPNARPDIDVCGSDSDCTLVDRGCCASCEPVSGDSLIAVNVRRAQAGDYRDPCPPIACAPCPSLDELQTTRQYFRAVCGGGGKCLVQDIRNTEYTRCMADADCVLRDGAECCEGCDGRGLVALNPSQVGLPCGENTACPDCVSVIPPEYAAQCQSGDCRAIRHVDAGAR